MLTHSRPGCLLALPPRPQPPAMMSPCPESLLDPGWPGTARDVPSAQRSLGGPSASAPGWLGGQPLGLTSLSSLPLPRLSEPAGSLCSPGKGLFRCVPNLLLCLQGRALPNLAVVGWAAGYTPERLPDWGMGEKGTPPGGSVGRPRRARHPGIHSRRQRGPSFLPPRPSSARAFLSSLSPSPDPGGHLAAEPPAGLQACDWKLPSVWVEPGKETNSCPGRVGTLTLSPLSLLVTVESPPQNPRALGDTDRKQVVSS